MVSAPKLIDWPMCPKCGEAAWSIGNDIREGWSIGHSNQKLPDCRIRPEIAETFAAEWAKRDKGEVTPEQLAQSLQDAEPYIDEHVIDGGLQPLVGWLCQHYRITPR